MSLLDPCTLDDLFLNVSGKAFHELPRLRSAIELFSAHQRARYRRKVTVIVSDLRYTVVITRFALKSLEILTCIDALTLISFLVFARKELLKCLLLAVFLRIGRTKEPPDALIIVDNNLVESLILRDYIYPEELLYVYKEVGDVVIIKMRGLRASRMRQGWNGAGIGNRALLLHHIGS